MKLARLKYDPDDSLEFYERALSALGALCERTWHDRLEVVAEGRAAKLWNPGGALHEVELHFVPADATAAREAVREIFPGCPLTFQLAEALRPSPLALERFVLPDDTGSRPPDCGVAEKLWRSQFPETRRWQLTAPFKSDFHFSLLGISRCEIQAIDQHWSLHRVAISLPDGEPDEALARSISFHKTGGTAADIPWPSSDPARWQQLLASALEREVADDLVGVQARQQQSLHRELDRIDDYFENYERELATRARRSSSENSKLKVADRLAAAKAEHSRRRADQVARHEINVRLHLDTFLLIAESAWRAHLRIENAHRVQNKEALFVPRSRRWQACGAPG